MTTDIAQMGPHALASYQSRALALASFGIDPTVLTLYRKQDRSLAKQSRSKRALMIQSEHELMTLGHHEIVGTYISEVPEILDETLISMGKNNV